MQDESFSFWQNITRICFRGGQKVRKNAGIAGIQSSRMLRLTFQRSENAHLEKMIITDESRQFSFNQIRAI